MCFTSSKVKQFVIAISIFCKWFWLCLLQKQYQNETDSCGLTNTQVMIGLMWMDHYQYYLPSFRHVLLAESVFLSGKHFVMINHLLAESMFLAIAGIVYLSGKFFAMTNHLAVLVFLLENILK